MADRSPPVGARALHRRAGGGRGRRRFGPALLALAAALALAAGLVAGCRLGPAERWDVLLVSADSLRTDRLRPWNPEAAVPTPHLEELAAGGVTYVNAWASSPWTAPSMVSVFTGLYPPSHGVAYRDDTTPRELPTLPRLLAHRGYRLGNFSFFSQISYFRNLGLGEPVPGLTHGTVAEVFGAWLAEVPPEEPFFAWVHLLETHLPYGASGYEAMEVKVPGTSGLEAAQRAATLPVGSAELAPGDREALLRLYDEDVAAMDEALGRVLAALEASDRRQRTLVVFVADHGEELLEHGWIGHASTAVEAKLVPEILHIPVVIAGPGVPEGQIRHLTARQVDILPTLGELLGLPLPEALDGSPLPGLGSFWATSPLAYFDSAPGGNLTPRERRGERLQGVTDGECLLSVHLRPGQAEEEAWLEVGPGGSACGAETRQPLRDALESWRRRQAAQRLELLARSPGPEAPAGGEIDDFRAAIRVVAPAAGARLSRRETGGQIALEWQGGEAPWWIEYRLGEEPRMVAGAFQVEQSRIVFGPLPEGFWNDLATYSPLRFRVADAESRSRSEWMELQVLPAGGGARSAAGAGSNG